MVNGFLFYQNFPFGAAHGLKSWVQLESDNLVTFKETGVRYYQILHSIVMVRIQEASAIW